MAVVQNNSPTDRRKIITWIQETAALAPTEINMAALPGDNLWHELGEKLTWDQPPQRGVLALWSLEETAEAFTPDATPPVMQQLNVQRDLFVRDFPVFLGVVHQSLSPR